MADYDGGRSWGTFSTGEKVRGGSAAISGPGTIISVGRQFGNFADGQRLQNSVTLLMEGHRGAARAPCQVGIANVRSRADRKLMTVILN